jgi:hypothetical protein
MILPSLFFESPTGELKRFNLPSKLLGPIAAVKKIKSIQPLLDLRRPTVVRSIPTALEALQVVHMP